MSFRIPGPPDTTRNFRIIYVSDSDEVAGAERTLVVEVYRRPVELGFEEIQSPWDVGRKLVVKVKVESLEEPVVGKKVKLEARWEGGGLLSPGGALLGEEERKRSTKKAKTYPTSKSKKSGKTSKKRVKKRGL